MPRVPRVESQSVGPSGLPQVRSSLNINTQSPGPNIGNIAASTSRDLQKFILNEKRKADDISVQEFSNEAIRIKNDMIYGENGIASKRGRQILEEDVVGDSDKEFDARINDAASRFLKNGAQKQFGSQVRNKIFADFNESRQKHIFTESRNYSAQVHEESRKTYIADAKQNYHNQEIVNESEQRLRAITNSQAQDEGRSPEWLENTLEKSVSELHTGVVDSMLADGQDRAAKTYFESKEKLFTGDDRDRLKRSIETSSIRGESQRLALEIVNKHGTNVTSALRAVDKIKDPKLEDETRRRVKTRINDLKLAENDRKDELFDTALKVVFQSKDVHDIHPRLWNDLTFKQQQDLRDVAQNKIQPDLNRFYSLMDQLDSPDINIRKAIYNSNLMKEFVFLGPDKFDEFFKKATKTRENDASGKGVPASSLKDKEIQDKVIGEFMKLDPNSKAAKKTNLPFGKKVAEFRQDYALAVERAIEQNNNKPIDTKEKIAIAEGLAIELNTGERLFQVDLTQRARDPEFVIGGKKFDFEISQIPEVDRQRVLLFLKAQPGRRITEQRIKETWLLMRFGGLAKDAD